MPAHRNLIRLAAEMPKSDPRRRELLTFLAADENWIPKDLEEGRCTPAPNPDCPVGSPQYNLAQTFKKHPEWGEKGGKKAKDLPKDVERYVEEGKAQGLGEDEAWGVAWSRYCRYKNPGSPHCKKDAPDDYFPGRKAASASIDNVFKEFPTKYRRKSKDGKHEVHWMSGEWLVLEDLSPADLKKMWTALSWKPSSKKAEGHFPGRSASERTADVDADAALMGMAKAFAKMVGGKIESHEPIETRELTTTSDITSGEAVVTLPLFPSLSSQPAKIGFGASVSQGYLLINPIVYGSSAKSVLPANFSLAQPIERIPSETAGFLSKLLEYLLPGIKQEEARRSAEPQYTAAFPALEKTIKAALQPLGATDFIIFKPKASIQKWQRNLQLGQPIPFGDVNIVVDGLLSDYAADPRGKAAYAAARGALVKALRRFQVGSVRAKLSSKPGMWSGGRLDMHVFLYLEGMEPKKLGSSKKAFGERMQSATEKEYNKAIRNAPGARKEHIDGGKRSMDVEWKDRGTLVAKKTILYTRGKVSQELYMVNPEYLKGRVTASTLRRRLIRVAAEMPKGSEGRTALLGLLTKVASKPMNPQVNRGSVAEGNAFMAYRIDASASAKGASKFYEGYIEPSDGGYEFTRMWGALTDNAQGKNIRTKKVWHQDLGSAQRELAGELRKRIQRQYTDAFGPRHVDPNTGKKLRQGQYPVGLYRPGLGFGHGTEEIAACSPALRLLGQSVSAAIQSIETGDAVAEIQEDVTSALSNLDRGAVDDRDTAAILRKRLMAVLRRLTGSGRFLPDDDGRRLRKELVWVKNYVEKQLAFCA